MVTLKRNDNPPNVPHLRPIEDFWGILKQEVYQGGWVAKSEAHLKRRIRVALEKIDPEVPRTMMKGIGLRVRLADRHGVLDVAH